jgi:2-polyprenyl-6-hydroxyphenyl methylase / 3-demethylubiquinone-9 3-methyltransferase
MSTHTEATHTEATQSKAPNRDDAELAKFSALAHKWWDKTGDFKPLHQINPLRLAHIEQKAFGKPGGLAGKRVLDVGAGGGILAESMAQKGANVLGIDLAEKPLAVAKLHAYEAAATLKGTLEYRLVAAEQLAEECPATFDLVTCMEMLEHVPDPAATVRACATLVKPGGTVVFSTINRNPKSFLFAIVGAEYVLRLLPKGTHEYRKFITPAELSRFAREAGLDVKDLTGMTYNPITDIYKLGRDADVNYILATGRPA